MRKWGGQIIGNHVDKLLTTKSGKGGQNTDSQAYIYMYIYIYACCRVKHLSKNCAFLSQNLSKNSFFFLFWFSKICFFLQVEWDFQKKTKEKEDKQLPLFWVKNLSNYVAQHAWTDFWLNLGQIFDSTFSRFWPSFSFLNICWNPYFIGLSSKIKFL